MSEDIVSTPRTGSIDRSTYSLKDLQTAKRDSKSSFGETIFTLNFLLFHSILCGLAASSLMEEMEKKEL